VTREWKARDLGHVATLQRGFDLPHRHRRPGTVPIVTSSGVGGGAGDTHCEAKVAGPGVVTGRYGTIGDVFFIKQDFWPLNTTLFVKNFHGNHPLFIAYLLRTIDFHTHSGKSGVPGVNRNDLHRLTVRFPESTEEQRAIAAALSDVDALLDGLDRLIAKKRDLKQAAMQQLLTGKTRLPGFAGRWKTKRLGELLTIAHGKSQHGVEAPGGQFPILATGGEIGRATRFVHDRPSVLIGRKGSINRPQYMDTPFWTVDTLFYSVVHEPNVAKFLYYCFCAIDWMTYNEASGVPSLNARTIEAIEIGSPDAQEQEAIAAALSDMDAELAALKQRRDKTRLLKQGMMQELLTGRTRLV
jgi:type I restriction enzyme, S subunit